MICNIRKKKEVLYNSVICSKNILHMLIGTLFYLQVNSELLT